MPAKSPREKFQELLRELFQFDSADLDFGIYRIMNHKRAIIEEFIQKDLLDAVSAELSAGAVREEGDLARQLEEKRAAIRENLGADYLDGDGNLLKGEDSKLGREYLALQERASGAHSRAGSDALVFNHLYQFFSRYYDRGDFLSLRHYSRQQKFAVPYNGEEVYLHWANKGQYYIKTGEYFTNYRWQAGSGAQRVNVLFRLSEAVVEKDNIKAPETRYFLPQTDALAWDTDTRTLTLPMHWRGLLAGEETRFGTKNVQDAIVEAALTDIEKHSLLKNNTELKAALLAPQTGPDGQPRVNDKGAPISRLRHHLRRYARRNTSDFFIHKDLAGFLARELDFYLKNEVLHLDDLEKGGPARADGWFQLVRAIRAIGTKIVAFLAQIEEFQKRLFEKKKFVTECHYAITLDRVPETLYAEIAANAAQREEWVKLCAIDEIERDTTQPGYSRPLKVDFLKAHRFLMVDTRHFDSEFEDRLLAEIPNLDEQTDGVVVNSDNFQALILLSAKHSSGVSLLFIDPPYNTGSDGFIYKDAYQHSSWLAMMENSLRAVRRLLDAKALAFITIDFVEVSRLRLLCDALLGVDNFLADIAWEKRYTRSNNAKRFYSLKDTVLCYRASEKLSEVKEGRTERSKNHYVNPDDDPRGPWISSSYVNPATKAARSNLVYKIRNPFKEVDVEHPTHAWKYDPETHKRHVDEDRLYWGEDGSYEYPRLKTFLSEASPGMVPVDVWSYKDTGTTDDGGKILKALFGGEVFENPKPVQLVCRSINLDQTGDAVPYVLDYVAGSGTTGHAVIQVNREKEEHRKYLLVEMGEHFDTVLVPRLKKVVYAKDWKEGKPVSRETGVSHAMKILRLESYDDALSNIGFGNEEQGQALMDLEGYKLSYLLDFETRESATFLNVAQLRSPFRYTLDIRDGEETRRQRVDLPETFSYLIGLIVERRTVHERKAGKQSHHYLLYRGKTREADTPTAVLWREIEGWKEDDFQREKEWLASERLLDGADRTYVNGTSAIEGAESLDPLFKRLLFAGTTAATT